jgi:hypothetical protein
VADPDRLEHPPRRDTRFEPEDEAYLIGPHEELLAVLRRDRPSPQAADSPTGRPTTGSGGGSGRAQPATDVA